MKSEVYFGDEKIKRAFNKLKESQFQEKEVYKWINKALDELAANAFCGKQIPKKQIPQIYIKKYKIDNLWKYNLPSGWRLLYSVANDKICVITIILEWMNHKDYENRFNYFY